MDDRDRRREEAAADFDEAELLGWLEQQLELRGHLKPKNGERVTRLAIADEGVLAEIDRPVIWHPRADRGHGARLAAAGGYSDATQFPLGDSGMLDLSVEWSSLGLHVTWTATVLETREWDRLLVLRFVGADGSNLRDPVRAPLLEGEWPEELSDPAFDTSAPWQLALSIE